MDSTLWELQAFDKAHEIMLKEKDSLNYYMGEYHYEAISAALSNALSRQGKSFNDIRSKPMLSDLSIDDEEEEFDEQTAYENHVIDRQIAKLNWDLQQIYNNQTSGE